MSFNRQEKTFIFLSVILIRQENYYFFGGYAIFLVVVSDAYAGEE